MIGPSDRPLDSLRRRPAGQHENPRATDKHVLRHNKRSMDVMGPSSSTRNSDVFLGHVLGLESDELNRLQSWRDEEENDTETSADSGHVSIDYDSPPYQNGGVGPSFQFNGNHTNKYFEKVERFDIDQEFGFGMKGTDGNLGELNVSQKAVKDRRVSAVNGALPYHPNNSIPRTNNRSVGHVVPRGNSKGVLIGPQNYSNPLCIQTGEERSVVAPAQFLRTQSRHDSPQSISSNSSESSQLSTPNSDAETRSSSPRPRNRARPNSPSSRALVRGLPPTNNHPNDSTAFNRKETRTDRTMGSISLYQRNKGDCNSLTPEDRLDTRVTDPVIKKSQNESKSDEKPTTEFHRLSMPSVGVQELLSEIPALKLTTRDEKPVQILTRAEKDSENECGVLPVEKSKRTIYVPSPTQDPKQTVNGKLPQVSRTAPKPVPRKRAKTPPARTGAEVGNLVVTSTKAINEPRTISSDDSIDVNEDFLRQERGPGLISKDQMFESGMKLKDEVANAAGESTLRNETIRGSKKSGKRVSLDPHAVLLHASLEGELDLVKTIIHQVGRGPFAITLGEATT